ncbi:MAG: tRNA (adenosine(37)-N6)-dimethylallyltransferase MiaA [bacterium]|nr:tRNA (adenosine(37)-N6)-dimethylallyltransferase MiaA [bacterium]
MTYNCIAVLGPTASGKTALACGVAFHLDGEVISADSRQVYKHLDLGTGKDLQEYVIDGKIIPHHLIDVAEPGDQFYLHQFIAELEKSYRDITARKKLPIICGGSGLYLDALHKDFSLTAIKENETLRATLKHLEKQELLKKLEGYPKELTQQVDRSSSKRLLRGIEIAEHLQNFPNKVQHVTPAYKPYYLGINTDAEERKKKITQRLKKRMEEGLVKEVNHLLTMGISHERLQHLGLEYKFVSLYLLHKITRVELFDQLQIAIFQFAKRQMTWFRKMEKEGIEIHWLEPGMPIEQLANSLRKEFSVD